jgi:hypothetical protein
MFRASKLALILASLATAVPAFSLTWATGST